MNELSISQLEPITLALVQNYGLTFVRIAVFVFCVPPFLGRPVPIRFRFGLIAILTIVAAPSTGPTVTGNVPLLVLQEAIVGFALGFSMSLLLTAFQIAGSLVERLAGGSLLFQSSSEGGSPLSTFYYGLATTLMFVSGAHRIAIDGLLRTVSTLPPGVEWTIPATSEFLGELLTTSFEFSLRVAGPVAIVLLAASMVTAIISRFVRTFSFFGIGMSVNAMLLVGAIFVSCVFLPTVFEQHLEMALDIASRFIDSIRT